MYFQRKNSLAIARFGAFDNLPYVQAYFTTRLGGVSEAPFDSLNLGLGTDDAKDRVIENRSRLFDALKIDPSTLVRQQQVHGANIVYAQEPGLNENTDACFTDRKNIYLVVTAADCVPILLVEPRKQIVGVIHAGWRGTKGRIAFHTIERIKNDLQVDVSDMIAVLGPSISVKNYEVSEEVAREFDEPFIVRDGFSKPHLDLWKANADQLRQAGVHNISIADACTVENPDLFFSHRASGGRTGRMLGIIGLNHG